MKSSIIINNMLSLTKSYVFTQTTRPVTQLLSRSIVNTSPSISSPIINSNISIRYMSSVESMALRAKDVEIELDRVKLHNHNSDNNKTETIELSNIPLSLRTANQSEITKHKIELAVEKFKLHSSDTGSAPVQIAVMTEKIHNMARHFTQHKKDKHSARGFQILVARRKKMMQYLKRYDFEAFKSTIISLGLQKEASHLR